MTDFPIIKFRDCAYQRPNGQQVRGREMRDMDDDELLEVYKETTCAFRVVCAEMTAMPEEVRRSPEADQHRIKHYVFRKIRSTVACMLVDRRLLK